MYATMNYCNNFFEQTAESGSYQIATKKIIVRGKYKAGQYIRIMGSTLNDGVYKIKTVVGNEIELTEAGQDESFVGYIVGLVVPNDFIALSEKVEAYKATGVSSESIPNYSVSYAASDGFGAFKTELNRYRKPFISPYYFLNWVTVW